jgi:membrane fusion protein
MLDELFRREAIEHQRQRLYGEVQLSTPPPTWMMTALFAAIALGAGVLLATGIYARKETVPGWLVPEGGIARIVASAPGVIAAVHVEEGALVAIGDPIATVSRETGLASGGQLIETLLAELNAEAAALEDRRSLIAPRFAARRTELETNLQTLEAQRTAMLEQKRLQAARASAAQNLLRSYETLKAEKAASTLEVERQREASLQQQQGAQDVVLRLANLDSDLARVSTALASLPIKEATAIAEIDGALSALRARRAGVEREAGEILRAPMDGRVAALPARAGMSVAAGALAAMIVPEGECDENSASIDARQKTIDARTPDAEPCTPTLIAELFVPTRAAGFLEVGQEVRLKIDAFPWQKYGVLIGRIRSITSAPILAEDGSPIKPTAELPFVAHIELAETNSVPPKSYMRLRLGMKIQASVSAETMTFGRLLMM